MKSIWRGSPDVEPVSSGIGNILEDFASLVKEQCFNFFLFRA